MANDNKNIKSRFGHDLRASAKGVKQDKISEKTIEKGKIYAVEFYPDTMTPVVPWKFKFKLDRSKVPSEKYYELENTMESIISGLTSDPSYLIGQNCEITWTGPTHLRRATVRLINGRDGRTPDEMSKLAMLEGKGFSIINFPGTMSM
jgi:hypothetical protein